MTTSKTENTGRFIPSAWEVISYYDVWGNENDGFEVNDATYIDRQYEVEIMVVIYNAGSEYAFESATLSDDQIRKVFNIHPHVEIETDGDDMNIEVSLKENGYPVGRLVCISHSSLSPIEAIDGFEFNDSFDMDRFDDDEIDG